MRKRASLRHSAERGGQAKVGDGMRWVGEELTILRLRHRRQAFPAVAEAGEQKKGWRARGGRRERVPRWRGAGPVEEEGLRSSVITKIVCKIER